jgi:hypothetical protein
MSDRHAQGLGRQPPNLATLSFLNARVNRSRWSTRYAKGPHVDATRPRSNRSAHFGSVFDFGVGFRKDPEHHLAPSEGVSFLHGAEVADDAVGRSHDPACSDLPA